MTPRAIAMILLKYVGVTSLDPDANTTSLLKRGLSDNDLQECATCITGALQEAFDDGPAFISEQAMARVLRPPTTITFGVTRYETAIAGVTGYQSWMEGCTVRISGDPLDNRLLSATKLLRPYMGGTGTVSGTVYADCIPLPSSVKNVLEPVEIPDNARLHMANSAEEFRRWNGADCAPATGNPHPFAASNSYSLTNKSVGDPVVAFADSHWDSNSAFLPLYLRFNPMPGDAIPVTFRVKNKPPVITTAMLDNGNHTTDPNAVIPMDFCESIILPFSLQRWTAHPNFSGTQGQLEEIGRQYTRARKALQGLKPQISRTRGVYSAG